MPEVLPHLAELGEAPFVFRMHFGLDELPGEPGLILVRGPRQYGKSTWLEGQIRTTIVKHGRGSALYLNGDEIEDVRQLTAVVRETIAAFRTDADVRRLFIDEITAVKNWEKGLKVLLDAGELKRTLVVTTGSKATDLRRGAERLPGRKGRLARTAYLFTPVSYAEFKRVCGRRLKRDALVAYLLSGGSPVACGELASRGRLPEYVPAMIRDWVYGECASSGRARSSLLAVFHAILAWGGTPVGQAKLARECGLANNTLAAGYVELLADLMCVGIAQAWDASRGVRRMRRPAKFHMINLLAAVAWDPMNLRSVADFRGMDPPERERWWEWLVAQELWRRAAIEGREFPEIMAFWQSKQHEIDFVLPGQRYVEVKHGPSGAMEFAWFDRTFPKGQMTVISSRRFQAQRVRGVTMEDFLLGEGV